MGLDSWNLLNGVPLCVFAAAAVEAEVAETSGEFTAASLAGKADAVGTGVAGVAEAAATPAGTARFRFCGVSWVPIALGLEKGC